DLTNILRVTHGSIFNTIAKIRSTTRNTLVRQLAEQANDVVLDHIAQMEGSGLVNFDQVNAQETSPQKLPSNQVTPPVPQSGVPMVVLTPPPGVSAEGVPTGTSVPATPNVPAAPSGSATVG
ncbi:hypothetical protein FGX00_04265, partial [Xylella fastidiosa subsp. multiplex]|nr:hypothetical protein [Xylella fastidiosa subsp. multiplex]